MANIAEIRPNAHAREHEQHPEQSHAHCPRSLPDECFAFIQAPGVSLTVIQEVVPESPKGRRLRRRPARATPHESATSENATRTVKQPRDTEPRQLRRRSS